MYTKDAKTTSASPAAAHQSEKKAPTAGNTYGRAFAYAAIQTHYETKQKSKRTQSELDRYLEDPLEQVEDPVKWWGVRNYASQCAVSLTDC